MMPLPDALRVLNFSSPNDLTTDTLKKRYRQLAIQYHPDRNPDAQNKMVELNNANDALEAYLKSGQDRGYQSRNPAWHEERVRTHYRPQEDNYRGRNVPPWETDQRSSFHGTDGGRRNINFCKKEIYEYSMQQGPVQEFSIWAFDGNFFRGVFSCFTNEASLGFAGEVMEEWNSNGANPYATEAVVSIDKHMPDRFKIIRAHGQDISHRDLTYDFYPPGNPGNDRETTRWLQDILRRI